LAFYFHKTYFYSIYILRSTYNFLEVLQLHSGLLLHVSSDTLKLLDVFHRSLLP
jgi:hypothetical protein